MQLSREAKLVSGIILLSIPTIMYGGITLLSILTQGVSGFGAEGIALDEVQFALWRAGHAHAGVWVILSLVMQILIDSAKLSSSMKWLSRVSAPIAAVSISGGFFGVAFLPEFRWLIYFGTFNLLLSALLTGVGLLKNLRIAHLHT
ncbi:hypothetical protein [Microbulbifer spongiae]|uniref:Uncharacterized protein n=1 Tax=Microbulbifer spongiae TaxID=2944933 RepID=A0ABY9EFJ1_9GAMM|nr:hypothetical protein [Microbulbifer sp. MI-G]WKD50294.1 hypothetical protein M8T91_02360 [Microbulbifer sp. MI-G]